MKILKNVLAYLQAHPDFYLLIRYVGLFSLLILSLFSLALFRIVAVESNPFFYAGF